MQKLKKSKKWSLVGCYLSTQQSTIHLASRCYMDMISNHFMSYNKFSWQYIFYDYIFYDQPIIGDPTTQFSSAIYYQMTGFWPRQLDEICHEMVLLPDVIRCPSNCCRATKHFALFLLLKRWYISGTWESVSYDFMTTTLLVYSEISCYLHTFSSFI
jgi:hypothetical protein